MSTTDYWPIFHISKRVSEEKGNEKFPDLPWKSENEFFFLIFFSFLTNRPPPLASTSALFNTCTTPSTTKSSLRPLCEHSMLLTIRKSKALWEESLCFFWDFNWNLVYVYICTYLCVKKGKLCGKPTTTLSDCQIYVPLSGTPLALLVMSSVSLRKVKIHENAMQKQKTLSYAFICSAATSTASFHFVLCNCHWFGDWWCEVIEKAACILRSTLRIQSSPLSWVNSSAIVCTQKRLSNFSILHSAYYNALRLWHFFASLCQLACWLFVYLQSEIFLPFSIQFVVGSEMEWSLENWICKFLSNHSSVYTYIYISHVAIYIILLIFSFSPLSMLCKYTYVHLCGL